MPKSLVRSVPYSSHQKSHLLLALTVCMLLALPAPAAVKSISLQSPSLSVNQTTDLISPIHIEATAEDLSIVTGYVVYVDNQNVYRNFSPSLDAWITLPPGNHTLYVKAWDSQSHLATPTYHINIKGFAPPSPPVQARRIGNIDQATWTVDNNPDVGGDCNNGSIGAFASYSDPNTWNLPAFDGGGQHFILNSRCTYDDSLFYRKVDTNPTSVGGATNFLWDFWFYIPNTTKTSTVQALEFDMFQAVQMSDGVHEFMFGSQCNYISNQWQFWLPQHNYLTWVDSGISPCRFSTGTWHHATYFVQRVTPSGFQEIPNSFTPATDRNTSLRFGTLTIDGVTWYLGGVAWSTIPNPAWEPVLGVQHQLDSAAAGVTIREYVDRESLIYW